MAATYRSASEACRITLYTTCPNLRQAVWQIRSPSEDDYQCIAWAACRTDDSLWPAQNYGWFEGHPLVQQALDAPVEYFVNAFATLGYELCTSEAFEFGYQKVAILANNQGATHMARQQYWGRWWLSKIGPAEDILHKTLRDVEGSMLPEAWQYGRVARVLRRSWWSSVITGCLFRCILHSAKHFYCRVTHPSWDRSIPTQ
jgi:hypothetical protein